MSDSRNMILAVVLSAAVLFGYEFFFAEPVAQDQAAQTEAAGDSNVPQPKADSPAAMPSVPGIVTGTLSRTEALGESPRLKIRSHRLHGSIALRGARIDDLTLADYREKLDAESAEITVLSPKGSNAAYFAEFGWVGQDVNLPGADSLWQADGQTLSPETPVTLRWDNGEGLVFVRTIALDTNYVFTVTDRVENKSGQAVDLHAYGLIARHETPEITGFFILHEGLLGVFNETLNEVDYDDLKDGPAVEDTTTGGWMGITDKYWLTALIPDQNTAVNTRFVYSGKSGQDQYQADFLGPKHSVAAGSSVEVTNRLFAGAKEISLLDKYEEELGVKQFDLAIDFGWFYFLTKPIFYVLIWLNQHLGNFGLAILLLTVGIKIVFFPLANKSYKSMSKMKKLQPEMAKLKERFGEDKMRLNQEMMALYKREGANPASGCLPILVQIPVFFALYKVLFVTIEMRHAPFYGWVHDLSAKDPTSIWNLFGMIPWDPSMIIPDAINIGVWPILMGLTMFLQQKLNPQPADPVQAKIFLFLPFIFTFLLAAFPAGLVIYWAWNNSLSIAQQWVIMRRMGVPIGDKK